MVNPFLNDPIERVTRDPVRKLGWEDRLIGAMRLSIEAGVQPVLLAEGARAALARAAQESSTVAEDLLLNVWPREVPPHQTEPILNMLLS